ncbi:MAG: AAA family ATPase [Spirochaetaceae bacterium]|jgi:KaiC/GvpD/RAD55 family RecA-like ATPase|nr:AAA family ATPase [Spirochaetaceae bacterium]
MNMNISAITAKLFSPRPVSGETIAAKDFGVLDHIEKVVEISQKHGIGKCLDKGKIHLDYITRKLDISPLQGILFSHFMERSTDNRIMIGEIAESIHCSKVRIIKYINECDELEKKKLIRCSRDGERISFRVPRDVRDSLRKYNEFRPEKNENLVISKFFAVLEKLFEERENDELDFDTLTVELQALISMNMQLEFCKKILSYKLPEDDLVLLICFCHLYGNNNDDNIGVHDFAFLYENRSAAADIKREFTDGSHALISGKYVEYTNNNGFVNNESYKLSGMAKKELLTELNGGGKQNYQKNLILCGGIQSKKMFYNPKEAEEIKKLTALLQEENYRAIQERLTGKGMRKGFACLFSGGPGTGKTETAYQIARETKRNILMVDISEVKSCFYGESEKRIKEIFDNYRTAVDNSETAPILLFNEADAVIGKRREISGVNHSIDQTENTIQNIILQEMENLSGILIATTNLSQNMDSAFERRFLYKIVFEKPAAESRAAIWNALLPEAAADSTAELSRRFELSGGQIENIARKIEVDAIISGNGLCMDTLTQYCKDEMHNGLCTGKRIGFAHE